MKTKSAWACLLLMILGLFMVWPAWQPACAQMHAVQPSGRFAGRWVAERESVVTYLSSVLFPASAQCEWFHGNLLYTFKPGPTVRGTVTNTLEIVTNGAIVHLLRGRSGRGGPTRITFGMNLAYAAPYTIKARDQILEFGAPSPDASSCSIENLTVNDVEVMRDSGSVDMLGLPLNFTASKMNYRFLGDNRLELIPIFPPASDGVNIVPSPIILRRQ